MDLDLPDQKKVEEIIRDSLKYVPRPRKTPVCRNCGSPDHKTYSCPTPGQTMARPISSKREWMRDHMEQHKQLIFGSQDQMKDEMRKLQQGPHNWAILIYERGSEQHMLWNKSGTGLDKLQEEFPVNKIQYAVYSQPVRDEKTGNTINKNLLITLVGEGVPIETKTRVGHHRIQIANFLRNTIPFHAHYEANATKDSLTEDKFLAALRAVI